MFGKTRVRDVPRAKEAFPIRTARRRTFGGPHLGEMRSVHGRPSIKLVGIGLSVSILPKFFHGFAFSGVWVSRTPRVSQNVRGTKEAQCDKKNGHLPLGFEPRL